MENIFVFKTPLATRGAVTHDRRVGSWISVTMVDTGILELNLEFSN
jgi:hypothetical protein